MEDPAMRITSGDALRRTVLIATSLASIAVLGACNGGTPTAVQPTHTSVTEASPTHTFEPPAPVPQGWPAEELAKDSNPDLQALTDYKDILQHHLPDSYMTFTGMPDSLEQAESDAITMADTLKQFHDTDVRPLVVMEPKSYDDGAVYDLNKIASGGYDDIMKTYYQTLKQQGVTDEMMGEWVMLPEANNPSLNITDPVIVRSGIIRLAGVQKEVFPGSQVAILLDSETYKSNDDPGRSNDPDWSSGEYKPLTPFLHDMPAGLIDSFILEGFPWVDPGAAPTTVDSPREFLPAWMAIQAAQTLGVHRVGFNTGTFASMHDDPHNPAARVVMSAPERGQLLQGIAEQALAAKAAGLTVTVNVFAANEDKNEGTDFSYMHSAADQKVLAAFVDRARASGLLLSLYDSRQP